MLHQHMIHLMLVILAVIGGVAVIAVLGVWLMHATMMGGMMGCGSWFVGLLMIAALVVAPIVLMRRKPRL